MDPSSRSYISGVAVGTVSNRAPVPPRSNSSSARMVFPCATTRMTRPSHNAGRICPSKRGLTLPATSSIDSPPSGRSPHNQGCPHSGPWMRAASSNFIPSRIPKLRSFSRVVAWRVPPFAPISARARSAVRRARCSSEVQTASKRNPRLRSSWPAARACASPSSVSATSVQPVNRCSTFQML